MKNDSLTSEFGQLFMAGLPGPDLDESTVELIRQYHVNNFILFTRNTLSPDQVRSLTRDLLAACSRIGVPPPLIAIDQEGGTVARLPDPFSQFADARMYAESTEPETSLENFALTCGHELHDVGINMNLAPVLDICPAGQNFFMEKRSLGNDPERVRRLPVWSLPRCRNVESRPAPNIFPDWSRENRSASSPAGCPPPAGATASRLGPVSKGHIIRSRGRHDVPYRLYRS